jgi:CubicO group peptidase (beta-lactamase class C family)
VLIVFPSPDHANPCCGEIMQALLKSRLLEWCIACCAAIAVVPTADAQPLSPAQIDALVERARQTFDVPGIAVAVVKDDQVVHAKGYGVRSLKSGLPVDERTLFGIASNTKAFTTAALSILVDEGKLRWSDRVIDHIPEFRLYSPWVTEEFTIVDLLTHRSGLGLGAGDLMFFPDGSDFTRADVIHNLRFFKSTSSFRSKYDYDNNLYIVAGEIVARASGLSFEAFIEQRILRPLGMNDSAASRRRLNAAANVVEPHVPIEGKVVAVDAELGEVANAAGGIYSSVADLSRWVRMQLNGGVYAVEPERRLFSAAAKHMMWSPQTIIALPDVANPYNTHFLAYGLGWFLADVKGWKQISHTGGLTGMVTQVTLIPELKLGIVVLTNQQSGDAFRAITNTLKDAYLGLPPVDRVAEYRQRAADAAAKADKVTADVWQEVHRKDRPPPPLEAGALAGTYRDDWFGQVMINLTGGRLMFAAKRSPKLIGEMLHYRGTTYAVKWFDRSLDADAFATFQLDTEGRPAGLSMKAISPLTDFSFDFHDLDLRVVR